MNPTTRAAAVFGLVIALTSVGHSKPKDVPGWRSARWGMTTAQLVQALGSQAQKQPTWELYGDGSYEYLVPGIKLQGQSFTGFLVMNQEGKLGAVDVRLDEMESSVPREDVFNKLESLLTKRYGAPDSKKDERPSKAPIQTLTLSCTCRFPTTTLNPRCYCD